MAGASFFGFGGFSGIAEGAFFFSLRLRASSAIVCVLSAVRRARPRISAASCSGVIFTPRDEGSSIVSSSILSVEGGGVLPVMSLYIVALYPDY